METAGLSYGVPYSQYSWFNQEPTRFRQERRGKFSYCEMVTIAEDTCKYRSCPRKLQTENLHVGRGKRRKGGGEMGKRRVVRQPMFATLNTHTSPEGMRYPCYPMQRFVSEARAYMRKTFGSPSRWFLYAISRPREIFAKREKRVNRSRQSSMRVSVPFSSRAGENNFVFRSYVVSSVTPIFDVTRGD